MGGINITPAFDKRLKSEEERELTLKIHKILETDTAKNKLSFGHDELMVEVNALYEQVHVLQNAPTASFDGAPKEYVHSLIVAEQAKLEFSDKSHPDHRATVDKVERMYKIYGNAVDTPNPVPGQSIPTVGAKDSTRLVPTHGWTENDTERARLREQADAQRFSSSGSPLKFVS